MMAKKLTNKQKEAWDILRGLQLTVDVRVSGNYDLTENTHVFLTLPDGMFYRTVVDDGKVMFKIDQKYIGWPADIAVMSKDQTYTSLTVQLTRSGIYHICLPADLNYHG